jgi:hypothetical protein
MVYHQPVAKGNVGADESTSKLIVSKLLKGVKLLRALVLSAYGACGHKKPLL